MNNEAIIQFCSRMISRIMQNSKGDVIPVSRHSSILRSHPEPHSIISNYYSSKIFRSLSLIGLRPPANPNLEDASNIRWFGKVWVQEGAGGGGGNNGSRNAITMWNNLRIIMQQTQSWEILALLVWRKFFERKFSP